MKGLSSRQAFSLSQTRAVPPARRLRENRGPEVIHISTAVHRVRFAAPVAARSSRYAVETHWSAIYELDPTRRQCWTVGNSPEHVLAASRAAKKTLDDEVFPTQPCADAAAESASRATAENSLGRMTTETHEEGWPTMPASRSRAILLVDDDELITESFAAIFRGEGYEVAVAKDGREALEAAIGRSFDVILLDLLLPGMDGLTTLECLGKVTSESRVLVITGDAEADPRQLLALGASAVVPKPPDVGKLLQLVAQLCRAAKSSDAIVAVD